MVVVEGRPTNITEGGKPRERRKFTSKWRLIEDTETRRTRQTNSRIVDEKEEEEEVVEEEEEEVEVEWGEGGKGGRNRKGRGCNRLPNMQVLFVPLLGMT
ncbi:hypothetical protein E2C01_073430 [Portunus trituberculatus]|uniref:Uncharacterized protein n=1 Tax=Portunus trituberculatus TaxID=210409 RepID=A0A5B7I5C0_PORTR|nr:hypothetical protein [Portunus trituberculatus]